LDISSEPFIGIESEEGAGFLPRVDVATDADDRSPTPAPHEGAILLVEDDPGVRSLCRRALEREGLMPGMTGRELGEQLRPYHPGLRILHLSANSPPIQEASRSVDDQNVLLKPFTGSGPLQAIRQSLSAPGTE
jgi:CheY-like chemotaxis protein